MDIDFLMLKAQHEALRNYFVSLLPTIFKCDEQQQIDGSKSWLAKYFLWKFECENLSSFDCNEQRSPLEKEKVNHRLLQLQTLMDVAYIQGGLEDYDLHRHITPEAARIAQLVFSDSDGGEQGMCSLIDEYYAS